MSCQINNISGVCWCRQCGITGDTISYLEKCENLSFKDALHELGISENPQSFTRRRTAPTKQAEKISYIPKKRNQPHEKWIEYANKILQEAKESIWNYKAPLKWLAERGIDEAAILRYHIGFLAGENSKQGRYRHRSALGDGNNTLHADGLDGDTIKAGNGNNTIDVERVIHDSNIPLYVMKDGNNLAIGTGGSDWAIIYDWYTNPGLDYVSLGDSMYTTADIASLAAASASSTQSTTSGFSTDGLTAIDFSQLASVEISGVQLNTADAVFA